MIGAGEIIMWFKRFRRPSSGQNAGRDLAAFPALRLGRLSCPRAAYLVSAGTWLVAMQIGSLPARPVVARVIVAPRNSRR
jgi:hypothetical protein